MSVCVGVCAYCERTLNYWFHEHPIFWIMRKIKKKKLIRWCWKWTGIYRGSGRAQSRPCGCIWSSTQVGESCSNIEDGMGLGSFKFGSYLDFAGRQGIDWTNRYQQCNLVLSTKWCIIIAAMSFKPMGWTGVFSVPHGMRSAFRKFCSIAAWFIMEN